MENVENGIIYSLLGTPFCQGKWKASLFLLGENAKPTQPRITLTQDFIANVEDSASQTHIWKQNLKLSYLLLYLTLRFLNRWGSSNCN